MRRPVPKLFDVIFTFYSAFIYLELVLIFLVEIDLYGKAFLCLGILYLQSPAIWFILKSIYGPVPKVSFIGKKASEGNLWYLGHKLQEIYDTFGVLEKILKSIPGAYSGWLCLWGAKIGQKVNWTSGCKLVDRPHIHVGARALVGNMSYVSAHAIKKKDGKYFLYVKDVEIKEDVVISYAVTISPGVTLEEKSFIESGAVVYPNEVIGQGQKYERFEELSDERFKFLFKRD